MFLLKSSWISVSNKVAGECILWLDQKKVTNLFGAEENKGPSTVKLFAKWNRSKINIIFIQAGLIDLRNEA